MGGGHGAENKLLTTDDIIGFDGFRSMLFRGISNLKDEDYIQISSIRVSKDLVKLECKFLCCIIYFKFKYEN